MKRRVFYTTVAASLAAFAVTAQVAEQMSEDEARERVARVQSDMRSLHTALEAYYVDWNVYPGSLSHVTTPVAYMTGLFQDPFAAPLPEGAEPPAHLNPAGGWFGDPGLLKMGVVNDDEAPAGARFVAYSAGPDGDDDRGEKIYDPTNGTFSDGDVVRVISDRSVPLVAMDRQYGELLIEASARLSALREAVITWSLTEEDFPADLQSLGMVSGQDEGVPGDPFLPGLPMGYRVTGEGLERTATIYSVGPDLDDDLGEKRAPISAPDATAPPDGDVVVAVPWEEVVNRRAPYSDESGYEGGVHPWKAALLDLKERDGRDNAFLWYHEASALSPGIPGNDQGEVLNEIRKGDTARADMIRPWLSMWKDSFALMEQGAAVGSSRGPGFDQGAATPVPNYLAAQMAAKALAADAVLALEAGDTGRAVGNIETGFLMARDYQTEDVPLISHLIGYALTSITADAAAVVIDSGKLTREQLTDLVETLPRAERTAGLAEAMRSEHAMMLVTLEQQLRQLHEDAESEGALSESDRKQVAAMLTELGLSPGDFPPVEETIALMREWNEQWATQLEAPFHERRYDPPPVPEELHPLAKHFLTIAQPNMQEADIRRATALTRLRLTRIGAAAEEYFQETGTPAQTIDDLTERLGGSVPLDVFTGSPYHYALNEDGSWRIWSQGPDQDDDSGLSFYDPSNGTISDGDLVFPSL